MAARPARTLPRGISRRDKLEMAVGHHLAVTGVVWYNGAMWSLALAVLSFLCGWLFTAIPAVICGHG
jgi:hypothetical protein